MIGLENLQKAAGSTKKTKRIGRVKEAVGAKLLQKAVKVKLQEKVITKKEVLKADSNRFKEDYQK